MFNKKYLSIVGIILSFIILPLISALTIVGDTSYNSTDTNITQETGFSHLNISDSDIIIYAPMDIDKATIIDYSDEGNDGIRHNLTYTTGIYGGAYDFNANESYIGYGQDGIETNVTYVNFTLSIWNYFKTTGSTSRPVEGYFGGYNPRFYVLIRNDAISRYTRFLVRDCASSSVWADHPFPSDPTGQWHHLVYVMNGLTAITYYDGVVINVTDVSANDWTSCGGHFHIENVGKYSTNYWNGTIDEFMWIDRELSSAEVTALYNNQSARFHGTGEMKFRDLNFGSNDTANVTLTNCNTTLGSNLNVSFNGGNQIAFSSCVANNVNIPSPVTDANMTIHFNTDSYDFYSPFIEGNMTLLSFLSVTPFVPPNASLVSRIYPCSNITPYVQLNRSLSFQ